VTNHDITDDRKAQDVANAFKPLAEVGIVTEERRKLMKPVNRWLPLRIVRAGIGDNRWWVFSHKGATICGPLAEDEATAIVAAVNDYPTLLDNTDKLAAAEAENKAKDERIATMKAEKDIAIETAREYISEFADDLGMNSAACVQMYDLLYAAALAARPAPESGEKEGG
jgi:hypothetical protein